MNYIDCCKRLGVEVKSDKATIKAAYRKLVLENHPDKGGNPILFKQIQEAYEYLENADFSYKVDTSMYDTIRDPITDDWFFSKNEKSSDDIIKEMLLRYKKEWKEEQRKKENATTTVNITLSIKLNAKELFYGTTKSYKVKFKQNNLSYSTEITNVFKPKLLDDYIVKGVISTGQKLVVTLVISSIIDYLDEISYYYDSLNNNVIRVIKCDMEGMKVVNTDKSKGFVKTGIKGDKIDVYSGNYITDKKSLYAITRDKKHD